MANAIGVVDDEIDESGGVDAPASDSSTASQPGQHPAKGRRFTLAGNLQQSLAAQSWGVEGEAPAATDDAATHTAHPNVLESDDDLRAEVEDGVKEGVPAVLSIMRTRRDSTGSVSWCADALTGLCAGNGEAAMCGHAWMEHEVDRCTYWQFGGVTCAVIFPSP